MLRLLVWGFFAGPLIDTDAAIGAPLQALNLRRRPQSRTTRIPARLLWQIPELSKGSCHSDGVTDAYIFFTFIRPRGHCFCQYAAPRSLVPTWPESDVLGAPCFSG